ncbi:hypothetical protein [Desulfovibrio sp. 86]|uniref:hypothetical protein n=1 Tax=Desulfovibrio sp. 86 TaxID=2666132 RepID=UPI0015D38F1D|nr:hypothetical protein [Desulfovibrio sp. 86]
MGGSVTGRANNIQILLRAEIFLLHARGFSRRSTTVSSGAASLLKGALIKETPGNAQLLRLARRDLFLKQEWTLPSSTVSKKAKQRRQTE